jgi:NAD(P)H-hydrate epimerase
MDQPGTEAETETAEQVAFAPPPAARPLAPRSGGHEGIDFAPLLTAAEMRALEGRAIKEWGVPSLVLQEHAALGALALIPEGEPIHVLAGPGNNGGDALALARLALLRGARVEVWAPCGSNWGGDAAVQARLWEGLGGTYRHADNPAQEASGWRGWVVDGLLGLGSRLPIGGDALAWAEALGRSERGFKVLALDLPTGLDPGSGDVPGPAVLADRTACFGHIKRCHGLRPARGLCGEISLVPMPLNARPQCSLGLLRRPPLAAPRWNSHKYELGHVAIRAGARGMGGAAVLAVLGALRGGAGFVTALPDQDAAAAVASHVPEAIVKTWQDCGGMLPKNADVLLAGPGGVSDVPEWRGPLVLDASALGEGTGKKWMSRPGTILTPHAGECSRLFGLKIGPGTQDRIEAVERIMAECAGSVDGLNGPPAVLVLKGAQTLIAGGGQARIYVNPTGHPGLSTGGSGDFLAGLVAARYALDASDPLKAACEAVWLHGAAADALGPGPLLVRELGPSLAGLMRGARESQC